MWLELHSKEIKVANHNKKALDMESRLAYYMLGM